MKDDHEELSQIGITLANHFACVYYVDIETGSYHEYVYTEAMSNRGLPVSGEDYFADFGIYASKWLHPDDLQVYRKAVDTAICGNAQVTPIYYRARKADGTYVMLTTRAFILSDCEGKPEYFGGIIVAN